MSDGDARPRPVRRALVVGSGPAGMTAAIALTGAGVTCEVVEIEDVLRPAGVGLLLQSPALRALKRLDLMDEAIRHGCRHDFLDLTTPAGVTAPPRS